MSNWIVHTSAFVLGPEKKSRTSWSQSCLDCKAVMAGTWRQSRSRRLIAPRTSWLRLVNSLNLQFCRASAKSKHFLSDNGNVCCLPEHAAEFEKKPARSGHFERPAYGDRRRRLKRRGCASSQARAHFYGRRTRRWRSSLAGSCRQSHCQLTKLKPLFATDYFC